MAHSSDEIKKELLETSKIVENTLKSVAAQIGDIFQDALSEADSITKIFGKDIDKQLKSLARSTDKMIENQLKIKAGTASSKDIAKQLVDYETKREVLEKRIANLMQEQPGLAAELKNQLIDVDKANEDYVEGLKKQQAELEKIEGTVGVLGKLVKGLNKIPIIGDLIDSDKAITAMNQAAANGAGKMGALATGAKNVGTSIAKGLADPLTLIIFFTKKAFEANAQAVELGKALGTAGDSYRETLANIELASGNINVTTANLTKAFKELSDATGFAYKFTADQLTTQIKLTEQVGLQADEAAQIQNYAVTTGKTSEETYRLFVRGLATARNQLRVGINFKSALAEAAKVSGELAANLGYNPELIAAAVVQTKALGTTLEQTKAQGDALLNFESSIENELKAELLTGQQLNLEKARAAALTGDQVTLAKELANQGLTLQKFESMNVLARRSYAESLGLNVDQLSKQLQLQKQALESGKSFAQVSEDEAAAALERQNAQDKFNKGIEKLTSLIGNLLAGPLGVFIDMLTNIFGLLDKIISGIESLLGPSITKALSGAALGFAVSGGNPLGALIGGIGGGISGAMGDGIFPSDGPAIISPNEGGIFQGTKNDEVLVGPGLASANLGGGSIDLSPMIAAINQVKASVDKLYSKDTTINMDGKRVGTTLTQGSYKVA